MTHEFKSIIQTAVKWQNEGLKMVLATVVALEGSSYRRPGVRMLLAENGKWVGAVSGGCVEKEVYRQAQHVFENGKARLMSYDGTYRLGCEGTLYVLLEPFTVQDEFLTSFEKALSSRQNFSIKSFYEPGTDNQESSKNQGSIISIGSEDFTFQPESKTSDFDASASFEQEFGPLFQLCIFGAEHDAVALAKLADNLGWEVHIFASPDEHKTIDFFEGASSLKTPTFDAINPSDFGENTAVILMTHSFNKDVQYLLALKDSKPDYLGLLGPAHRREKLLGKFLEFHPEAEIEFLERLHGPAGIDIGAESAYEIGVSIIGEILSVTRNRNPQPLKNKSGRIHA
ncbi:XdhC family protein [Algoriphagus sediminis]|uniref:XdhC family protein n=1 Tax=Algoriphagus sediminis TaxID=3057113 RepID=A0ABT7YFG9_9BACT|nr:XdhC family protein [Algoriphagus sediminis]MDN3205242.1 XdhC family protein [Algoriphagus sediminis]